MLSASLRHWFEPAVRAYLPFNSLTPGSGQWSTSSFGAATDTSMPELFDLHEHLHLCRRARGRLFAAMCLFDSVRRFLAPRFTTTMVAIAALSAMLAML